jgi:hypothetical protein
VPIAPPSHAAPPCRQLGVAVHWVGRAERLSEYAPLGDRDAGAEARGERVFALPLTLACADGVALSGATEVVGERVMVVDADTEPEGVRAGESESCAEAEAPTRLAVGKGAQEPSTFAGEGVGLVRLGEGSGLRDARAEGVSLRVMDGELVTFGERVPVMDLGGESDADAVGAAGEREGSDEREPEGDREDEGEDAGERDSEGRAERAAEGEGVFDMELSRDEVPVGGGERDADAAAEIEAATRTRFAVGKGSHEPSTLAGEAVGLVRLGEGSGLRDARAEGVSLRETDGELVTFGERVPVMDLGGESDADGQRVTAADRDGDSDALASGVLEPPRNASCENSASTSKGPEGVGCADEERVMRKGVAEGEEESLREGSADPEAEGECETRSDAEPDVVNFEDSEGDLDTAPLLEEEAELQAEPEARGERDDVSDAAAETLSETEGVAVASGFVGLGVLVPPMGLPVGKGATEPTTLPGEAVAPVEGLYAKGVRLAPTVLEAVTMADAATVREPRTEGVNAAERVADADAPPRGEGVAAPLPDGLPLPVGSTLPEGALLAVRSPVGPPLADAATVGTPESFCETVCVGLGTPLRGGGAEKVPVATGESDARTMLGLGEALERALPEGPTTERVGVAAAEGDGCAVRCAVLDIEPRPLVLDWAERDSEGDARGDRVPEAEDVLEREGCGDAEREPQPHAAVRVGEEAPDGEGADALGEELPEGASAVAVGGYVAEVEGAFVRLGAALSEGREVPVPRRMLAVGKGSHEPATLAAEGVAAAETAARFEGTPGALRLTRGEALADAVSSPDAEGEGVEEGERAASAEAFAEGVDESLLLARALRVAAAAVPVGSAVGALEGLSVSEGRADAEAVRSWEARGVAEGEVLTDRLPVGSRVAATDAEDIAERDTEGHALRVPVPEPLRVGRALPGPAALTVGAPCVAVAPTEPESESVAPLEGRALLEVDLEGAGEPLKDAHADADLHAEPLRAFEAVAPRPGLTEPVPVVVEEALGRAKLRVAPPLARAGAVVLAEGLGLEDGDGERVLRGEGVAKLLRKARAETEPERVAMRVAPAEAVGAEGVGRVVLLGACALAVGPAAPKVASGPPSEGVLRGEREARVEREPALEGETFDERDADALRLAETDRPLLLEPVLVVVGERVGSAVGLALPLRRGEKDTGGLFEALREGTSRVKVALREASREGRGFALPVGAKTVHVGDAVGGRELRGDAVTVGDSRDEGETFLEGAEEMEGKTPLPDSARGAPGAAATPGRAARPPPAAIAPPPPPSTCWKGPTGKGGSNATPPCQKMTKKRKARATGCGARSKPMIGDGGRLRVVGDSE